MFPRMVRSRFPSRSRSLFFLGQIQGLMKTFLVIEGDGWQAFGKDEIRKDMALVKQGDVPIEGLTEGYAGSSQTITVALTLQLVMSIFELQGKIFRELAGVMQAEDLAQSFSCMEHGAMGIHGGLGGDGEALVVVGDELGKKGIGCLDTVNTTQAQFLNQAVL